MRILVTGANGLLGQKLILALQQKKEIELIATARGKLNLPLQRGVFYSLDVTNEAEVNRVISTTKPSVVIHTAAMTQVDQCETDREECWKSNVNAVEYLIRACSKNNVHLIHVST